MPNNSISYEFGRVFSSTRPNIERMIWDNISANIPAVHYFNEAGQVEEKTGPVFQQRVLKELPSVLGYSGLDTLDPVEPDPWTVAEYEVKGISVPIKLRGLEIAKNSGTEKVYDLIEAVAEAAELSGIEALGGSTLGIFANASETDLDKVSGLQHALSTTQSTGSVGKLNRATHTYFRANVGTAITDFSAHGQDRVRSALLDAQRGNDTVDVIISDKATYNNYLSSLTTDINFNLPLAGDNPSGDVGFERIRFYGARWLFDANCPTGLIYGLNSRYVKLCVLQGRNFQMREVVLTENQDAVSMMLLWAGNLVFKALNRHFVVSGGDND